MATTEAGQTSRGILMKHLHVVTAKTGFDAFTVHSVVFPCGVGDLHEKGLMIRFAARGDTNLTAENLQCICPWNAQLLGYDPASNLVKGPAELR